jgi:signal transduction histidine kinase
MSSSLKETSDFLSFSITARTAILLGRENISSPHLAVLELVKNAYDADAKRVTVRFRKASTNKGTITFIDNGHGMNLDDLERKWMLIGTDNKQTNPISPEGRIKVGEKGIGRFALDRLASEVIVRTTSKYALEEPTYELSINWKKFENTNKELQSIKHPLKILPRSNTGGTRLELSNLRDRWESKDYKNMYRDLSSLIPPYGQKIQGFSINFDCDEAPELSGSLKSPFSEAALYKIRAKLNDKGQVSITITTRDSSENNQFRIFKKYTDRPWSELFDSKNEGIPKPECGPIEFVFDFYLRTSKSAKGTGITLGKLRDFLDSFGRIHVYRDGFRIRPYGDRQGGDWLDLNKRRVRHPAGVQSKKAGRWVVAENQIAGALFITRDGNPNLVDQSNRGGIMTNQAFRDMRAFVLKCIEIFETDRKSYELSKLPSEPESIDEEIDTVKDQLAESIDEIKDIINEQPDSPEKEHLLNVILTYKQDQSEKLESVGHKYKDEKVATITKMQLLQNQATVGIAVSSMGHEILGTSRKVLTATRKLVDRINKIMLIADEQIDVYVKRLRRYSHIIYAVSSFSLSHIGQNKRRRQSVNINNLIDTLNKEMLIDLAKANETQIESILGDLPNISVYPYEIESIVLNFVTNSLSALKRGGIPLSERKIEIETSHDKKNGQIILSVRDSGIGIPLEDTDRIFQLYSTKTDSENRPIGTGLGLLIVKDIVDNYKGKIKVINKGQKLPGAEFIVTLPVKR